MKSWVRESESASGRLTNSGDARTQGDSRNQELMFDVRIRCTWKSFQRLKYRWEANFLYCVDPTALPGDSQVMTDDIYDVRMRFYVRLIQHTKHRWEAEFLHFVDPRALPRNARTAARWQGCYCCCRQLIWRKRQRDGEMERTRIHIHTHTHVYIPCICIFVWSCMGWCMLARMLLLSPAIDFDTCM